MQLSDVALVDDKLPEHVMQYQRLPATVLTEERLASILSHETKNLTWSTASKYQTVLLARLAMWHRTQKI